MYFTHRRAEVKKILEDASRERQEGIQGQWQQASSFREILEQVRGNAEMIRRGYLAMRDCSWKEFKERYWEEEESPEWSVERIRDACEKVDAWALCRKYLRKSTDFLRRVIAPVGGMGGVTLSYNCPHCHRFPLEDYIWWVSMGHGDSKNRKKKHCSWWCAVCGGKYECRAPNRILIFQLGSSANEAKVFRAHVAPQGLCEKLINALKLLANQQTDGDSPIESIVTGLEARSRKGIMDGLRSFIEMVNHSALDVGPEAEIQWRLLRSVKGRSG